MSVRGVCAMAMVGLVLVSGPGGLRAQSVPLGLAVRLVDERVWVSTLDASSRRPAPRLPRARDVSTLPQAREGSAEPQTQDVPKAGSEVWIPLGSLLLPGLGQYMHGAVWPGVAYSGTAVAGVLGSRSGSAGFSTIPRDGSDQLAFEAAHVAATAGALSAWDAFHRAMPSLQAVGRYDFLGPREELADLLTAPVDMRFLGRWTTLVDLAFSAGVAGWVLADRDDGRAYEPYRVHDGAFITSLSLNAAVGEEAVFRGWLLPMLHQKLGGRFWAANTIQAALFGAGHIAQADDFALVIAASALYSGWVTRRNDWSVREVIFHHFWYDVLVGTAELLTDEARPVALLPIRIRF